MQPKLRPATYVVRGCVPNERFTWVQKLPGGVLVPDHGIAPHDSGTEVELSLTSRGLLANIIAGMFSKITREYFATEARSVKNRCDRVGKQLASELRMPLSK
jgi:hypothetical protein